MTSASLRNLSVSLIYCNPYEDTRICFVDMGKGECNPVTKILFYDKVNVKIFRLLHNFTILIFVRTTRL